MARIRSIKPEFWTSAQVMECSPIARLMFIGMWTFADDAGRFAYSEKTLKAQIFPSDDFSTDDIRRMIVELSSNGLLLIYEFSGQKYVQITGWQHQKIDRPRESKIPRPIVEASSNDRRGLATDLILPDLNRRDLILSNGSIASLESAPLNGASREARPLTLSAEAAAVLKKRA